MVGYILKDMLVDKMFQVFLFLPRIETSKTGNFVVLCGTDKDVDGIVRMPC